MRTASFSSGFGEKTAGRITRENPARWTVPLMYITASSVRAAITGSDEIKCACGCVAAM